MSKMLEQVAAKSPAMRVDLLAVLDRASVKSEWINMFSENMLNHGRVRVDFHVACSELDLAFRGDRVAA